MPSDISIAPAETFVPKNGDRVILRYDDDNAGSVVAAGSEVSEIKFDHNAIRCILNEHLRLQALRIAEPNYGGEK